MSPDDKELLSRMKLLSKDHSPDGYPAVQMRDVSRLVEIVERSQLLVDAAEKAMAELGALGRIDAEHPAISALMNALDEVRPV